MENIDTGACLQFLKDQGAFDTRHSGRTLGLHLTGTCQVLISWQCPTHWCFAGMFHSIYGTAFFTKQTTSFSDRQIIRNLIGIRAEQIVYNFCKLSSNRIEAILDSEYNDMEKMELFTLISANRVEIGRLPVNFIPYIDYLQIKTIDKMIEYNANFN